MASFQIRRLNVSYSGPVRPGLGTGGYITIKNDGPEEVRLCNIEPNAGGVDNTNVYHVAVGESVRVADPDPSAGTAPALTVFTESNGAWVSVISEGPENASS